MSKFTFLACGKVFKSKKEFREAIQAILYKYEFNVPLSELDKQFMIDALQYHDNCNEKTGVGIKDIIIKFQPEWKNRGFYIIRLDETIIDFSIGVILNGSTHRANVLAACRNSIKPFILEFRRKEFENKEFIISPYNSIKLFNNSQTVVDHEFPLTFLTLVEKFLNDYNLNFDNILIDTKTNPLVTLFQDDNQKTLWINYHNKNCKLRLLHWRENLSEAVKKLE